MEKFFISNVCILSCEKDARNHLLCICVSLIIENVSRDA